MDKVISRTISEIDKVKNENLELNDKLNRAREENERLKEEKGGMQILINGYIELTDTYKKALQEIRAIAERAFVVCDDDCGNANRFTDILDKINEVIGAE